MKNLHVKNAGWDYITDLDLFSRRLKEWRESMFITRDELGGALGITPNRIAKWELGKNLPNKYMMRNLYNMSEGVIQPNLCLSSYHSGHAATDAHMPTTWAWYRNEQAFMCWFNAHNMSWCAFRKKFALHGIPQIQHWQTRVPHPYHLAYLYNISEGRVTPNSFYLLCEKQYDT